MSILCITHNFGLFWLLCCKFTQGSVYFNIAKWCSGFPQLTNIRYDFMPTSLSLRQYFWTWVSLKIRLFRQKKTKKNHNFEYRRYSILRVWYSILFNILKRFEISGFDRYAVRYSQPWSWCHDKNDFDDETVITWNFLVQQHHYEYLNHK